VVFSKNPKHHQVDFTPLPVGKIANKIWKSVCLLIRHRLLFRRFCSLGWTPSCRTTWYMRFICFICSSKIYMRTKLFYWWNDSLLLAYVWRPTSRSSKKHKSYKMVFITGKLVSWCYIWKVLKASQRSTFVFPFMTTIFDDYVFYGSNLRFFTSFQ